MNARRIGAALIVLAGIASASRASAQDKDCSTEAVARAKIVADAPAAVLGASLERSQDGGNRYCLVKLRVGEMVNILVSLPIDGRWNGDIQAEGKGGYGGRLAPPLRGLARGFVGVASDTGHPAPAREPEQTPAGDWRDVDGAFAMREPGQPDRAAQVDFAYRSAHLMAVVARQVAAAYYGRPVDHAFYFGCSTEGRQGLRAAQQYPGDYDGILAGDPGVNFAQVMAYQIWPQLVMRERVGGPILAAKLDLASKQAIAACDKLDGLEDGLLTDPRRCRYSALKDRKLVVGTCRSSDDTCLSAVEARAIDEIWRGPVDPRGKPIWRGIERGAPLSLLAGAEPFPYAILQPRFWVYLDPNWDWRTLTLATYPAYFERSVAAVNPVMAGDETNLAPFFARGGKIMIYHGLNDAGILPHGSIDYDQAVARRMHMSPAALQAHLRLYLLAGVEHCGGGTAPQPSVERMFDALVDWVKRAKPPEGLIAVETRAGRKDRNRPLCAYPSFAYYRPPGDPDAASSFDCRVAPKMTPAAQVRIGPQGGGTPALMRPRSSRSPQRRP